MNEWLQIIILAMSASMFAIGGTGLKWVRRFALPLLLAVVFFAAGSDGRRAILLGVSLCCSFHLGYGDRTKYGQKFLVFVTYSASTLWIGLTWWQIALPILLWSLFVLSNLRQTAIMFQWKFVEFMYGALVAQTIISARIGGLAWQ